MRPSSQADGREKAPRGPICLEHRQPQDLKSEAFLFLEKKEKKKKKSVFYGCSVVETSFPGELRHAGLELGVPG